tara:strand:+ start:1211 stop:1366 length:156 start_codon:yes stop_codon:yes gene_type:complete
MNKNIRREGTKYITNLNGISMPDIRYSITPLKTLKIKDSITTALTMKKMIF